MINFYEVVETNQMIEEENLDVRTITLGISLMDCIDSDLDRLNEKIYKKITTLAKDLVSTGEKIESEFGIPIVNKRISITPVALVGGSACKKPEDFVTIAETLDKAAKEVGVNFIGGYSAIVSKGMTKSDELLIRSIPMAMAKTERVCSSVNVGSTKTGIDMDAVRLCGEIVKETAEATKNKDSIGCAKFVVLCNAPDDNPFMAGAFHGENGLGNVQLPLPDTAPEQTPAWDALYAAAKRMPGELRLVATGPLTNVAIALTKYPDLHGLLHSIALMGGAAVGGNVTPAAEFNIYDDPDAAQIVFKSGVPLVMCGLDVTMQAELRPADWDEMAGYGNRCGGLVKELFACAWKTIQTVGLTGVAQHDSCPVMYLAHPELFRAEEAGVYVETRGSITRGKTVTDLYSDKQFETKNARVVLGVDRDRFIAIVKDCIKTI